MLIQIQTNISVLLIVGPKCALAESTAAPWRVTVSMPTGQTDRRTDGRQTVTLRFPQDAASVINCQYTQHNNFYVVHDIEILFSIG